MTKAVKGYFLPYILVSQDLLIGNATSKNNNKSIKSVIVGYWVEDKNNRSNFEYYVLEIGPEINVNDAIYPQGWENEKVIYIDGNEITINEVKGPGAQYHQFRATLDNETFSEIDMGLLGGPRNATADMSENSLTLYVSKLSSQEIYLTISYTIDFSNPNVLVVKFRHIESNRHYSSLFRRQYIIEIAI